MMTKTKNEAITSSDQIQLMRQGISIAADGVSREGVVLQLMESPEKVLSCSYSLFNVDDYLYS